MAALARFQPASDQSLLVYFGETISPESRERVLKLLRLLETDPIRGVRNLHPGYSSLLVKFDAMKVSHGELQAALQDYLQRLSQVQLPAPRQVEIPVCYGGEFGPDLPQLAEAHDMTPQQAAEAHAAATYTVCFLGFAPGFAYLDGLPEALATPRLAVPRRRVPAGSVGIAGHQTGVYPFTTPGGWRLIGRTPLQMFRADRPGMCLLAIGDQVRFAPISPERFAALESA
jgi:KipI family sensor histidine kinase inhibitor